AAAAGIAGSNARPGVAVLDEAVVGGDVGEVAEDGAAIARAAHAAVLLDVAVVEDDVAQDELGLVFDDAANLGHTLAEETAGVAGDENARSFLGNGAAARIAGDVGV